MKDTKRQEAIENSKKEKEERQKIRQQQEQEEKERGYKMSHRPDENGSTGDDLTTGETPMPKDFYNNHFDQSANKNIINKISNFKKIFSDEIIIHALEITLNNNKSFRYALQILTNWKKANVASLDDAKNYFKSNKKTNILVLIKL